MTDDQKRKRLPRAHEGPDYTKDDMVRIRRGLEFYRQARRINGWKTVCIKINQFYLGARIINQSSPMHLRTLSRFMAGENIRPASIKILEGFVEAKAPIDKAIELGDAAASLFGEQFQGLSLAPPLDIELGEKFFRTYDVFLEGQAMTRNRSPGKTHDVYSRAYWLEYFVPKYPDREYTFDRPFEIPYSRIDLEAVEWSGWLQVHEKVSNQRMDEVDERWSGGEDARGILTLASISDQYVLILHGETSKRAKFYMIERDVNTWRNPPDKQNYIGAVIAFTGEGYLTTIGAKRVLLVPASGEKVGDDENK